MIIKVCGMRDAENIRAVSELNIDLLGFDFRPESPRFVRMVSSLAGTIPDYSEEQVRQKKNLSESPSQPLRQPARVGVFADDMPQSIVTRVYNYQLDFVQLNGNESRVMIEKAKGLIMMRDHKSEDEAYNYIRQISQQKHLSMRRVSEMILVRSM